MIKDPLWWLPLETVLTDSSAPTPVGQNRLLALNYVYPGEDPMVCAAHTAWGSTFQRRFSPLPPRIATAEDRCRAGNAAVCKSLFAVMS